MEFVSLFDKLFFNKVKLVIHDSKGLLISLLFFFLISLKNFVYSLINSEIKSTFINNFYLNLLFIYHKIWIYQYTNNNYTKNFNLYFIYIY